MKDLAGQQNLPNIKCNDVLLRPISVEYATSQYISWLNDPLINKYLEVRFENTTQELLELFLNSAIASSNVAFFAIHHGENHDFVGTVKLSDLKLQHLTGVVGFLVGDRRCWGKGVGTYAVGALCRFCIQELGLKKLRASCYESNIGSRRLLEKVGFNQEGTQRFQVESAHGREHLIDYGLVDIEFDRRSFPTSFETP